MEGLWIVIAFVLGAWVSKGMPIKKENKVVRKKRQELTEKSAKEDLATAIMLENISNYDGTGNGQQEVEDEFR